MATPGQKLDKSTVDLIVKLRNDGLSIRDIKSELAQANIHVAKSTISAYVRDCHVPESPIVDPVERMRKNAEIERQRKEHITAVKELSFRQFLENLVVNNVPQFPLPVPVKPTKINKKATLRYPLITFTDWHFEETVNPAGVMGLNEYGIDIACQRLYRIVHAIIDWKRDTEASGRFLIPSLHISLLGDMVTGTLHGAEKHTDSPNVVRSVLACGDLLAMAVEELHNEFHNVTLTGVGGNHARLPDQTKVPTKDPTRSWDYMVYQIAKRRLGERPGLSWFLPESYGVVFEVGGWWCYGSHGNFIPNNLGIVGYGVRRFASAIGSNLQAAGKPLRYCFFGHTHAANSSEFAGMEASICPALIGTQEYSFLSGGSVSRSAQEMHIFDREFGCCTKERFYGDGPNVGTYQLEI